VSAGVQSCVCIPSENIIRISQPPLFSKERVTTAPSEVTVITGESSMAQFIRLKASVVSVSNSLSQMLDKVLLSALIVAPDTLSLSSMVIQEFCIIFPVVQSNLVIALSVELTGQVTSPPQLEFIIGFAGSVESTVILVPHTTVCTTQSAQAAQVAPVAHVGQVKSHQSKDQVPAAFIYVSQVTVSK